MKIKKVKHTIFIFAYWHDSRFKRKVGGLIKIFDLADNLTRLGNSVVLFLPKIGYPREQTISRVIEVPFIDLPIIRPLSFHLLSTIFMLIKVIENPDIIYVRKMNSFLPLLVARLFKIPTFFEIPDDPYLAYKSSSMIKGSLEKKIDKYSMLLSAQIVVPSAWSKRRLNQIGRIPLAKITVVPSGTDTRLFKPMEKDKCCSMLGFDSSFNYVGFVGSFLITQGIDTLIDAAHAVVSKHPDTRFLLVGDGPMMKTWKGKVTRKKLQETFIFIGQVPYKNVPKYIGVMDICVAPHRKDSNQSSPVKLFDYMACARPIVASDTGAVREITKNSGCALLVSPDKPDELAQGVKILIEDKKLRKKMGKKGREYVVKHFDREKITMRLIQSISKLCCDLPC